MTRGLAPSSSRGEPSVTLRAARRAAAASPAVRSAFASPARERQRELAAAAASPCRWCGRSRRGRRAPSALRGDGQRQRARGSAACAGAASAANASARGGRALHRSGDRDRERAPVAARRVDAAADQLVAGAIVAGTWTQRLTPSVAHRRDAGQVERQHGLVGVRRRPAWCRRRCPCRAAWRAPSAYTVPVSPPAAISIRKRADRLVDAVHRHRVGDVAADARSSPSRPGASSLASDREAVVVGVAGDPRGAPPLAMTVPGTSWHAERRELALHVVRPALEVAAAGQVAAEPVDAARRASPRSARCSRSGRRRGHAASASGWRSASGVGDGRRRRRRRRRGRRAGSVAGVGVRGATRRQLAERRRRRRALELERGAQPLGRRGREREARADHRARLRPARRSPTGRVGREREQPQRSSCRCARSRTRRYGRS